MEEIWKDVLNYEGYYQVSNLGNVKSVERVIVKKNGRRCLHKSTVKKGYKTENGYVSFDLYKNGKRKKRFGHNLVMESFVGDANGLDTNHKNGIKNDNRLINLEYCTRSENMIHAFNNGLCKNTVKKQKEGSNSKRCVILNTESGVFHDSIVEASEVYGVYLGSLEKMLRGDRKLRFPLIKVGKTLKGKFI